VSTSPGWQERLGELYAYRQLVANLTIRDLKLKYKGSVLGVAWSLVNPLLQMAIYTIVFSLFLRIVTVPNYWAFVISGTLVWTFFSSCITGASVAFVRNPGLISKVYFPIESLPISMVLANFINLLIPMALLVVVLLVAGIHLGISLMLLPMILVCQLVMCIGLSLVVASATVFLRDIEHFLVLGVQVLFYLTPILYPLQVGALPQGAAKYVSILHLNPLAWYLDCYHAVLYFGVWPTSSDFLLMVGFSALCLLAGFFVFVRIRARLPEAV
jgi:ABC-2 type transport system permease protein